MSSTTAPAEAMCAVPDPADHPLWPQDREGDYPHLCQRHKPGPPRVPVVVEYVTRHVVWVEVPELDPDDGLADPEDWDPYDRQRLRDALGEAVRAIEHAPYEYTNDSETLVDAGYSTEVPSGLDYRFHIYSAYGDFPGSGHDYDAHVGLYRAERARLQRVGCAAAGHPERERPLRDGSQWCKGCQTLLPAPEAAAE